MTDFTEEETVVDSSLFVDSEIHNSFTSGDYGVRIGIVRDIIPNLDDEDKKEVIHIVNVQYYGREVTMGCTMVSRFGGPHNFEEWTPRNWAKFPIDSLDPSSAGGHEYRAGDRVLVVALDGDFRQGVILGALRHPSRSRLTPEGEIAYLSRFNGLDTEIRQDGTYKVTWRGLPTNDEALDTPPDGSEIVPPEFDEALSGSYYGFDNTGSYTVADNNGQLIKIVKSEEGGTMAIVSGATRIDLGDEIATITSAAVNISSDAVQIKGSESVFIDGAEVSLNGKISIGSGSVELLETLAKLVDALGDIVVTSPVGTCTPIKAAPTWSAVEELKGKIEQITGGGPQEVEAPEPVEDTDVFGEDLIV